MGSAEELSDVYAHFTLYYGKDLVSMRNHQARKSAAADDIDPMDTSLDGSQGRSSGSKKTTVKQAHRRDFYAICQENGLGSLAAKYGLTPEQFGENLRDIYQRHNTEQHNIEPEEAAEDYVQPTGWEDVLWSAEISQLLLWTRIVKFLFPAWQPHLVVNSFR